MTLVLPHAGPASTLSIKTPIHKFENMAQCVSALNELKVELKEGQFRNVIKNVYLETNRTNPRLDALAYKARNDMTFECYDINNLDEWKGIEW